LLASRCTRSNDPGSNQPNLVAVRRLIQAACSGWASRRLVDIVIA
jgi:hypothetical protein